MTTATTADEFPRGCGAAFSAKRRSERFVVTEADFRQNMRRELCTS